MNWATADDRNWQPALRPGAVLRRDDVRELDLLLMPERAVALNATGAAILASCDGCHSVTGVIDSCRDTFPDGFLAEDVLDFIEAFRARGWLV